jgi:hypothetical protein
MRRRLCLRHSSGLPGWSLHEMKEAWGSIFPDSRRADLPRIGLDPCVGPPILGPRNSRFRDLGDLPRCGAAVVVENRGSHCHNRYALGRPVLSAARQAQGPSSGREPW